MSKHHSQSVGVKLAQFLELPLDTTVDWPRLTVNANRNLIIQNHRGIIEYEQTLIRVNTKFGELKITGSNLALLSALKDEIVLEGKLNKIEMVDWR